MDKFAYFLDEDLIKIATKEELEADGIDVDYHLNHQNDYVEDKGILIHKVHLYNRKEVEIGRKVNMITIIQELPPRLYPQENYTRYQRRVKVKCDCGNTSKAFLNLFNRGDIQSCGCVPNTKKKTYKKDKDASGKFTSNPIMYKKLLEAMDDRDFELANKIVTKHFGGQEDGF